MEHRQCKDEVYLPLKCALIGFIKFILMKQFKVMFEIKVTKPSPFLPPPR